MNSKKPTKGTIDMSQVKDSNVVLEPNPKPQVEFLGEKLIDEIMSNMDDLEKMVAFSAYYGKINNTKYVVEGSVIGCTYGLEKTRIGITKDHAVSTANGNAVLTCSDCVAGENVYNFGICSSPYLNFLLAPKITIVPPPVYAQPIVTGPKCMLALTTKWLQDKAHTHIWNDNKGQYEEVLLSSATIACSYGRGLITIQEVNNAAQGTGNAPYNDYKTVTNPNLIGTNASKDYVTLQQLKARQFNFEYDRQTYINKLTNYTAADFQGIVTHITAYLNEIQVQLDYLNNGFSTISAQEIVTNFNYHIEKYGIGKHEESVLMFMAITAQESSYGKLMAERWSASLGYSYNQRGAGYSQLTGKTKSNSIGNQVPFLNSVGYTSNDITNIIDLPFHIATYLPFSSACYAWTKGNAAGCDITTDIIEYGMNKGADMKLIYLAVSYAINGGYTLSGLQKMIDGKVFNEPSKAPNGWADRKLSFNNAIQVFPHGKSMFVKF